MLFFVGTPIGNLGDITIRGIETLKSVDEIACEDTRHSLRLLDKYEIKKPIFSYHKFNERERTEQIIEKLKSGKNIALITDAGMPIISDPGNILCQRLIEEKLEYTVVAGGTAFVSALILSGLPADKFCFLGFLPNKQEKKKEFLKTYVHFDGTLIFYSAPHDVAKDISAMREIFGNRNACAVKEITKLHESVIRFKLSEWVEKEEKGEFVLLIEGEKENTEHLDLSPKELIDLYVNAGLSKMEALKKVAKEKNIAKSELYKFTIDK